MFSAIFSTSPPVDPTAPNFHPVTTAVKDGQFFGELTPQDTEWLCAGGFVTETQTFYTITDDGKMFLCQVIHSAIGMWYPTVTLNCKLYDTKTKETLWKSINVTNFMASPPGLDKRSSQGTEFSITYKSTSDNKEFPESYTFNATLSPDLEFKLEVFRPAAIPGWKVGAGEKGGFSYFGPDLTNPEGYVIHRFWPQYKSSGTIINNGVTTLLEGPGMFVHAIQGMRPNLIASAWNFNHFQSPDLGGVSAIQMEFVTTNDHGKAGAGSGFVKMSVGSLVVGGKLASVLAETVYPNEDSGTSGVTLKTELLGSVLDPETGYNAPSGVVSTWSGPSVISDKPGTYTAKLPLDLGDLANPKGLIEKVDVLAEIPYVIKMAVNYVSGTKPYIYQWFNPGTLEIIQPGSEAVVEAKGYAYTEASFIS